MTSPDSDASDGEDVPLFSSSTSTAAASIAATPTTRGPTRSKATKRPRPQEGNGASHAATGAAAAAAALAPGAPPTFASLGISPPIVTTLERALNIRSPTLVQENCIPPVLQGRNVLASAPTGSGKTAAFALPILETLARDPYGIYAVVLTPTRELAIQISEQFVAFGTSQRVRCEVVIGGLSILEQQLALAALPHVVVATPGRLAEHIRSSAPPRMSRARYLVLDEADRLLDSADFARDLACIARVMPPADSGRRQTLLFSATITDAAYARRMAGKAVGELVDIFEWHATPRPTTVASLKEEYVLVPAQVKHAYLAYLMRHLGPVQDPESNKLLKSSSKRAPASTSSSARVDHTAPGPLGVRATSMIIFTSSCRMCQLIVEMLGEVGIRAVPLHAQLSQGRRLAALGKFRSGVENVLVATDVASRGLDIPEVDLVLNYDLPRDPTNYVHRVGRTARAGRAGRAVAFVTQSDVKLVHAIEAETGKRLTAMEGVDDDKVAVLLTRATKAMQSAKLTLYDTGFEEALARKQARKEAKRPRGAHRKHGRRAASGGGSGGGVA